MSILGNIGWYQPAAGAEIYDPGLVQHPAATHVNRASAWTGEGVGEFGKFTFAAAFEYQAGPEANLYVGRYSRFRVTRLNSGQHYVRARNSSGVETLRFNQGGAGAVAGKKYLLLFSVDLSSAQGVNWEYHWIDILTGSIATNGTFVTWVQGGVMEIERSPYVMWAGENGSNSWPDESIYLGFWPDQFWDTGSIVDAFYDSTGNNLKDPLGSDVTSVIGTPRFLLEAPASNYNNGVNRAVPGDALAKQGTGTFTDV